MVPLEDALAQVDAVMASRPALPVEAVPLGKCVGRVLAEDVLARLDVPPFDQSKMDGYAILADDRRGNYDLLEVVAAGRMPSAPLRPGACVKVMTGAPLPERAGRVIVVENASEGSGSVTVHQHDPETYVRRRGEDLRVGDVALPAGTHVTPLALAHLASCGVERIRVTRRPTVALVSTGDEVATCMAGRGPAQVLDANGPMLAALAHQHGIQVVMRSHVPDALSLTRDAIRESLARADLLVVTGGVSAGDFDYVLPALTEEGLETHFSRVAVKPGKPTVFASGEDTIAFALPGNPVAAFLTFHLFVLRAIAWLTRRRPTRRALSVTLREAFRRRRAEREEWVPARLSDDLTCTPIEFHGSGHLAAVAVSDGFLVVPAGITELDLGAPATFVPLAWLAP